MELWIRTQSRENTVKIINGYGLKYNDKKTIIANYQPDFTDRYDGYYELLGTYETKERALEVLDEIQRIIYPKEYIEFISDIKNESKTEVIKNHYISYLSSYVYEMPEK